jgi:hypothetical protein
MMLATARLLVPDRYDVLAYTVPASTSDPDSDTDFDDGDRQRRRTVEFATWIAIVLVAGGTYLVADASLAATAAAVGAVYLLRTVAVDRYVPDPVTTDYRAVEAGRGTDIVTAHEHERDKRVRLRRVLLAVAVLVVVAAGALAGDFLGVAAVVVVVALGSLAPTDTDEARMVPEVVATALAADRAARRYDDLTFPDDRDGAETAATITGADTAAPTDG